MPAVLRRRAALSTARSYALDLIAAGLVLPARQQWRARRQARRPIEVGAAIADLIAADRAE